MHYIWLEKGISINFKLYLIEMMKNNFSVGRLLNGQFQVDFYHHAKKLKTLKKLFLHPK